MDCHCNFRPQRLPLFQLQGWILEPQHGLMLLYKVHKHILGKFENKYMCILTKNASILNNFYAIRRNNIRNTYVIRKCSY